MLFWIYSCKIFVIFNTFRVLCGEGFCCIVVYCSVTVKTVRLDIQYSWCCIKIFEKIKEDLCLSKRWLRCCL